VIFCPGRLIWWSLCSGLTVVVALLFLRFERLSLGEITPI
jgi:hypothetical protein